MQSILEKDEFTQEDILSYIETKLEESINIEFKDAAALTPKENDIKKEISKDVSAFANSDGGVLFYGINEDKNVASGVSFVDGKLHSKEWLENLLMGAIQPNIEGLKIIPVRFDKDISKTVYVVKIPKSFTGPHINKDKKFYRRYNFKAVAMEEYEVRGAYIKRYYGNVKLTNLKSIVQRADGIKLRARFHAIASNDNVEMSPSFKIACHISNAFGAIFEKNESYNISNLDDGEIQISSKTLSPLFPKENLCVLEFSFLIDPRDWDICMSGIKCNLTIFTEQSIKKIKCEIATILKGQKAKLDKRGV